MTDRNLPVQRLLNFVYLMERSVLDELALDVEIGATSVRWLIVSQAVRKASFDLMGAYFDRAQHESTSPTITDKLTTLYSRAMMDVVLSTEVQRAERFSFPMALIVFDVDKLAELTAAWLRGGRSRARAPGHPDTQVLPPERLGVPTWRRLDRGVLCQVAADDAFFLASRVVAMVEQRLEFKDHDTDDRVRVTVSAAAITGQGSIGEPFDAERLLLEADASLKRAKALGRNRVERTTIAPTSLSVQSAGTFCNARRRSCRR